LPITDPALESLAASHDIIRLGMMADEARRLRHGTSTTFVRLATIAADASAALPASGAAGEIRIGGVPASRAAAVARVGEVVAAANGVPVSAFSLADLDALAARDGTTLRAILEELRTAGLELVADAAIDTLDNPRRAIEEMNIAGLTLARLTVDRSPAADPVPLLKSVAELQRAVAVIRAFAPLPRRFNPAVPSTGFEDVKRVALARLIADNIASIQVDWALYGPKLAQVALTVGADDIDAVAAEEDAPQGRRRAPLEEVRRNIRAAGYEPVERNGRFDRLMQ
jgi:aminodeoxyfutalosine synthase